MSMQLVPETAPFNPQQRAWLNGFFAGVIGVLDQQRAQGGSSMSLAAAAAMLNPPMGSSLESVDAPAQEESLPWHDSSLAIDERMKLAEGKPKSLRLMAAMAQLNCGSCGYLCKTYAEAIATGSEKNLTLCSPGGSETAKMIRKIQKESAETSGTTTKESPTTKSVSAPGTRDNPVTAKLISNARLNGPQSAKDTRHVAIDLTGTGLRYKVGDALGVYPTNCTELVNEVLAMAKIASDIKVQSHGQEKPISQVLATKCLRVISPDLVDASITHIAQRPKFNGAVASDATLMEKLKLFAESDELDQWDIVEFLQHFQELYLPAQLLVDHLMDLRPRLYSIASSQTKFANEVHLTVGRVEKDVRGRVRKGVASTMFSDRVEEGAEVRAFIHSSHGFTVPADPAAPMIMVGPGTGIAPFMAFLQEREATKATGKNWLFFGDQKSSCDYLYQDELEAWKASGLLSRLDLAFSRDTDQKVYVQHRMLEHGAELFQWLEQGGYFFICGDASRMAVDVERALEAIISGHGKRSSSETKAYLANLTKAKRYVKDVY
jgi:sulfite reductase (NADPH) flavoprotein alpha-component